MTLMWIVSPTLAYNFSELIEAHAVDTYAEFVDANAELLQQLPPPAIALAYYSPGGERYVGAGAHAADASSPPPAPIRSLYDVFERIRDDEAAHVESMAGCQDGDVRARARIVELASLATAAAVFATSALTVEGVEEIESASAPYVQQAERAVSTELGSLEQRVEASVEREAAGLELQFEQALIDAETGANRWQGYEQ